MEIYKTKITLEISSYKEDFGARFHRHVMEVIGSLLGYILEYEVSFSTEKVSKEENEAKGD